MHNTDKKISNTLFSY